MLAIAFGFAGIVHLRSPESFLPIMPDWVPFPRQTILITGVCEIVGSTALLTRRLRKLAGVMLGTMLWVSPSAPLRGHGPSEAMAQKR
ncbi:DoxX family protein [Sphingobium sp. DEHP117]|uniref:DoxX family protein n=1 Tax=Sphingobium sp. DEHP117 TaxID=2993436 RepID=UPI0027D579AA|nr:DoxX family protein [Sphingobium sp. DEHP117]MDQ4421017.1 DoxX family protein [Sphingobium sp. DEHP117]